MAFANVLNCFVDQPSPAKAWLVAVEFASFGALAKTPRKDTDVPKLYDAPPAVLEFPFNPETLSITHNPDWSPSYDAAVYWRPLHYGGTAPDNLRFAVLLDESEDRDASWASDLLALFNPLFTAVSSLIGLKGNTNQVTAFVHALYALARPIVPSDTDGESDARPPLLVFAWGDFRFYGFLDSIEVRYLLFDLDGNPRRATVDLALSGRYLRESDATSVNVADFLVPGLKGSDGKDERDRIGGRGSGSSGALSKVSPDESGD